MPSSRMQGVFPILVTPFDEESRIDEDSLRRLIEFNLDAGVDGLGVALGSEVYKLTEAERGQVTRIVVDQVAGRVPVVINTGAQGTDVAVHYSRMAEENGADALMALPPSFTPAGPDQMLAYYRAISDAAPLPIFMQDVAASPISAGLARRLAQECEWVQYIKVESMPVVEKVAAMAAEAGDQLTVFGGRGRQLFYRRDAARVGGDDAVLHPAGSLCGHLETGARRGTRRAPGGRSTAIYCRWAVSPPKARACFTPSTRRFYATGGYYARQGCARRPRRWTRSPGRSWRHCWPNCIRTGRPLPERGGG